MKIKATYYSGDGSLQVQVTKADGVLLAGPYEWPASMPLAAVALETRRLIEAHLQKTKQPAMSPLAGLDGADLS
ncbi:MAG: hypothetical protein HY673_12985 [Chloroflexi bacterium]|nr:hypothetical protein [Chloroflexota bacterium]